mmetsp:Transcript_32476/g.97724  ORF Transcript_32476/g.97724 Transcript_32476/m.97724 type:complete len:270 (+) Transcript_32476:127-936(+)
MVRGDGIKRRYGGGYAVIVETPAVYSLAALVGGLPADHVVFDWRAGAGTWIRVVDVASGKVAATRRCAEEFFFFHVANCFVEGRTVHIDVAAYADGDMVNGLSLARMRMEAAADGAPRSRLARVSVNLDETDDALAPLAYVDDPSQNGHFCEFPVVDGRVAGRRHRYVYAVGFRRPGNVANLLTRTDVDAGTTTTCDFGGVAVVGEPLVVAKPGSDDPDKAALLVVIHDFGGRAHLSVVDAGAMAEVARATLPEPLPYGFHGCWVARDA